VRMHEARRHILDYGLGFDATTRGGSIPSGTVAVPGLPIIALPNSFQTSQSWFFGPSGSVEYTRLNLDGKNETLSAGGYAGRLDQRGSIALTNPNLYWTDFGGNLSLSADHDSRNPIYTAKTVQAGYQIGRALNPDRTTNLLLGYAFSVTELSRLLIPQLVPLRDQHIHLSTLSAAYQRDTRDNPLDAHRGMLESYEVDYSPSALGSSATFAKLLTQTAYYRKVADGLVWANNLRLGVAHAFGNSFVPLSQAFFSGGGSTLRGFPLDGAGPQRTVAACGDPANPATCSKINVPAGGNLLAIINSELRIPTPHIRSGLGLVGFYDGGNVFGSVSLASVRAGYTNTVGLGLRYATPVGPIRIDVGHNLNPISGIQSTQFFFSLGQAF
ncbi:MAG: BamA/OMP85 family outer membrane protein, partial [Terriglobales bacterium]